MDASSADVAALRSELGRLRAQVNALQGAAPPAASAAATPSETDVTKVETPESIAESEQRWHEHMAEVAFGFEQEPRDGRWATAASAAVANGLKRDPALAALAGPIDCRSTTCRVQVEQDAAGVVDKQLPMFLNGLTDTLPVMEAEHEVIDGKPRYTLYLKTAAALAHAVDAAEER